MENPIVIEDTCLRLQVRQGGVDRKEGEQGGGMGVGGAMCTM